MPEPRATSLAWSYNGARTPIHIGCGGEVLLFEDGPICGRCGASSDWPDDDWPRRGDSGDHEPIHR